MGRVLGLLMVAVIVLLSYRLYFSHLQQATGSGAPAAPIQTVNEVGVKNDLVMISRAEQSYRVSGTSYATLDQLVAEGYLKMSKDGRAGYTIDIEASQNEFRATARCSPPAAGCTSWMIDQTAQLQPAP